MFLFSGCINQYINYVEYKIISSKMVTYQANEDQLYSGNRVAVEFTNQEDALISYT
ncbi:hypothetical protein Hanom_Chr09g00764721 [Helianthus anomalus]